MSRCHVFTDVILIYVMLLCVYRHYTDVDISVLPTAGEKDSKHGNQHFVMGQDDRIEFELNNHCLGVCSKRLTL